MRSLVLVVATALCAQVAHAADPATAGSAADYDARLRQLEQRMQTLENEPAPAPTPTPAAPVSRGMAPASAFNPAIGVILNGTYSHFSRDPADYALPGFALGDETTPGRQGLSVGESELVMSANIDDKFYGNLITTISPENQIAVEEAYVQTIALPHGLTARAGRFFSGIGYMNQQHPHVWDFVDAPLVYRAFLNNQYNDDGVQLRWLAPTDLFIELGGEVFRGDNFPAGGAALSGSGTRTVFAHVGGDVGDSNSWRAGVSHLFARAADRASDTAAGTALYTGDTAITGADFVWKWAPHGNTTVHSFKLQGEYFHRHENGDFASTIGATPVSYQSGQDGWYLQGVYQFMPRWRVGLRHDALKSGTIPASLAGTVLDAGGYRPRRESAMVDFSNSEFSRIRLQYNDDRSQSQVDHQVFLQYIMSIGAHGAHIF